MSDRSPLKPQADSATPRVGIVMGSTSDWATMQYAVQVLDHFQIPYRVQVLSAHRMPRDMVAYADDPHNQQLAGIIAGAGGAAHLPGMLAALTHVPVFGVPVPSRHLRGEDSLLSIVQMPRGVPVATFAIGEAGAANAALHLVACMAVGQPELRQKLLDFRAEQTRAAQAMVVPPDEAAS